VTVIAQTRQLFLKGFTLYRARADKGFSLTDCEARFSLPCLQRRPLREDAVHATQADDRADVALHTLRGERSRFHPDPHLLAPWQEVRANPARPCQRGGPGRSRGHRRVEEVLLEALARVPDEETIARTNSGSSSRATELGAMMGEAHDRITLGQCMITM